MPIANLKGEEWRDIAGYEGLYQVSNCGRVKSLRRRIKIHGSHKVQKEQLLKPDTTNRGHLYVSLWKNEERVSFTIHRLVTFAFIGPPPAKGYEVRHFPDQDPTNNRVENLSWSTRLVNQRDRLANGTRGVKLTEDKVRQIRQLREGGLQTLADLFGVSRQTIYDIISGKRWKDVQ